MTKEEILQHLSNIRFAIENCTGMKKDFIALEMTYEAISKELLANIKEQKNEA